MRRPDGVQCVGSSRSHDAILDLWKTSLKHDKRKTTQGSLKDLREAFSVHINRRLLDGQGIFEGNRNIVYGPLSSGVGWLGLLNLERLSGRRNRQEDTRVLHAVLSEAFTALHYSSALVLDLRFSGEAHPLWLWNS